MPNLENIYFENSVGRYLTGIAIFLALFLSIYLALKLADFFFARASEKTDSQILRIVLKADKRLSPMFQLFPIYFLTIYWHINERVEKTLTAIWIIVATFCVTRFAADIARVLIMKYGEERTSFRPTILHSLSIVASVLFYIFGILFALANLGFNITTLITGLGIGGMAVALASQTLLSDLFCYFTILVDKPFEIGDYVTVGAVSGTVQTIGLKGTRILSVSGEQVVISNTDMTKSVVRNFQVMARRRVVTKLGLVYNTPREVMARIPEMLKSIVEGAEGVSFARAHFAEFGDFSLNVELVYFVLSKDYTDYMERQHNVNLKIMERFEREGITFAYPTQSLYLESEK